MDMGPYITFDGTCAEALTFYAGLMGGEIIVMHKFSEMPDQDGLSEDIGDLVMHAQLQLGDKILMASDCGPMMPYVPLQGFHIQTGWDDLDRARQVFEGLAEGGEITMPFEKTFWAAGFGLCRDRFGVPWMVNCDAGQDR